MTFAGSFTYTPAAASAVAASGGTFGSCGVNLCHNNGQSAAAIQGYTWNTAIGATNSCTECHGTDSATLTTQAHPTHNATPNCAQCHAAATVSTHANGSVNLPGTLAVTYAGNIQVSVTAPSRPARARRPAATWGA